MDNFEITPICQHTKVYTWVEKGKYVCKCGRIVSEEDLPEKHEVEVTKWFAVSIEDDQGKKTTHHVPEKYINNLDAVSDVFVDCYKDFMADEDLDVIYE